MSKYAYNVFTGALDIAGSESYIDGVVATPADLPVTVGTPALDSVYLAKAGSGVWLINRRPGGLYCRIANNGNANDWQHLGAFPEVNADGNWELYNSADPTKELKFDLSGITTGTTRTLTAPNASGRIQVEGQPIGNTTPSTGAFTTLSANNGTLTASAPVLDLSQTWNNAAVTFTGLRFNVTPTAYDHRSLIFSLEESSTPFFGIQSIIGVPPIQAVRLYGGSRGIRIGARNTSAAGSADFIGIRYQTATFTMLDGTEFGWSTLPYDSAPNLALHRDAADTLAQRRGTNAQTFRLYNTFTSTTNFERLNIIAQSAGSVIIGTEKGSGGGTARGLELRTDNVARINISATGGIGFYGAAASAQPAAVADATDAATVITQLNALLARLRTIGIIAT